MAPQLKNSTHFEGNDLRVSAEDWTWVSSLLTLGALVGALSAGFLMDTLGRKTTMILISFPFTIGWVLIITASHVRE